MVEPTPDTVAGARDRALLLIGFAGGFRRSELVVLDVEDLEGYRGAGDRDPGPIAAVTEPRLREVAALRQGWVPPRWTPTTCIEVLQGFYARQGRSPTMRELVNARRGTLPHPSTICRLFGSWSAGLAAAGLPLNPTVSSSPRWTNEQILAAIREAALAGDPTSRPFRLGNRRPWIGTIERRFGSWRVAQERAGVARPAEGS